MSKVVNALCIAIFLAIMAACTSSPTQESAGQFLDSSTLTAKVKASVIDGLGTRGLPIKVKTWKGEVQLSGYVDDASVKKRAALIASGVDGVKRLRNNIIVK